MQPDLDTYTRKGIYKSMIINELIDNVRYPDEMDGLYFDAIHYDKVIESLNIRLSFSKGQAKIDIEDTLAELERRWEEKKLKIKRVEIHARKVVSAV